VFEVDASISKNPAQLSLLSMLPPSELEELEVKVIPFNSTLVIPALFVVTVFVMQTATGAE
jgi:hypothetical protein